MRFATRIVVAQITTALVAVGVAAIAFSVVSAVQLRSEAESTALGIARTFAEDPDLRAAVTAAAADDGEPDLDALRTGEVAPLALATSERTGALFVVVTDDRGIRLAHPDPARIGEVVSTSYAEALAGRETVTWETGTLGYSARAKVPIRSSVDGTPVGEVSVGFALAGVFADLPLQLALTIGAAVVALVVAVLLAVRLRRRWERMTYGVQPEELIALVGQQTAVLDGVADGVLAIDPDGVILLANARAVTLLGLDEPVGQRVDELGLPSSIAAAIDAGTPHDDLVRGSAVLSLDSRPVSRNGRVLGVVVVIRDRTQLIGLADRLQSVRTMSDALRVQRHEFANRLHVTAGLIDAGRPLEARRFIDELLERGPVDFAVQGIDLLEDPFLQAFVGAKGVAARERGVTLEIAEDTFVLGRIAAAEDVGAAIGNLVDNAVRAAAAGDEPRRVSLSLLGDGDDLAITVVDTGNGIADGVDPFAGRGGADRDAVHGHGFGLPLSRELARRRGGEVWIVERRGEAGGAVVGARLPDVMTGGSDD